MKLRGTYKLSNRGRSVDVAYPDPLVHSEMRSQRILASLRSEIVSGAGSSLRIRQVFESPREIYRLELELPEFCYQRTTLLDRDALEELLEADDVRQAVDTSIAEG
jgi:hypothetical protein